MTLSKYAKPIFFAVALLLIIWFYVWSNLFWISLLLFYIADFMSIGYLLKFIKKLGSKLSYYTFKYISYIVIPIFFAIFIRTFVFDIYYVPSSSMERTLSPDDYVLVNKFVYGSKVPNRKRDLPVIGKLFSSSYLKAHEYNLNRPLEGFQLVKRDDIVVFKSVENNDKFLVKRVIGLPSETLKIIDSRVYINNQPLKDKDDYCYNYINKISQNFDINQTLSNKEYQSLNELEKKKLKKAIQDSVQSNFFIFPYSKQKQWTRDNYGEIIIPKKGMQITLTTDNFDIYKSIIKNYENEDLRIDKKNPISYIFKDNYYFMLGDNRHNSIDSRSYGFVPESYIQGKVITKF